MSIDGLCRLCVRRAKSITVEWLRSTRVTQSALRADQIQDDQAADGPWQDYVPFKTQAVPVRALLSSARLFGLRFLPFGPGEVVNIGITCSSRHLGDAQSDYRACAGARYAEVTFVLR